jgi:ABC-type multidrug transport system fused ATPase/permease subunit
MTAKSNPIVFLTRKFWQFSKGNRLQVYLFFLMFLVAYIVNFVEPLIVGWILNTVQEQGISLENIWYLAFIASLFIIVRVIFWIFHGPARVLQRKNAFMVRANYKQHLISGILKLAPTWHSSHHSGDTIDKIEKGTVAMYEYSGMVHEVIETTIRFVSSYLALAYFNLHSSYIVLFFVAITITIIVKFDKKIIPQYREINQKENSISSKIFDVISNITTVIILRIEYMMKKAIWKKILLPYEIYKKNIKINELKWAIVSILTSFMVFAVLISYFVQIIASKGTIAIGTVFILYTYVERINGLFYRFAFRYGEIVRRYASVNNSEEIAAFFKRKKPVKRLPKSYSWNKLEIKNLSFSYETEEESMQLKNINMGISKGEKIAFVGESGSGKTTMVKVIRGLYPVPKGEVIIDGEKVKGKFKALESFMSLIPQDPEIFNSTIKENITFGLKIPKNIMKKYTDLARVTSVINLLPKKEESLVYEKGVNLSGGEKQRLALARGLLASSLRPMVLLDEPTSSVDPKNELKIYKNIFKEFKDKTIISSIHRMHLLTMFDKIYLFQRGKIVAEGTFDELMKTSSLFRQQWKKYQKSKKETKQQQY